MLLGKELRIRIRTGRFSKINTWVSALVRNPYGTVSPEHDQINSQYTQLYQVQSALRNPHVTTVSFERYLRRLSAGGSYWTVFQERHLGKCTFLERIYEYGTDSSEYHEEKRSAQMSVPSTIIRNPRFGIRTVSFEYCLGMHFAFEFVPDDFSRTTLG